MSPALEILQARKEAAPWNFASNRAAAGLTPAATAGFTGGVAKLLSNVSPDLGRQVGFRNIASVYHSTGATGPLAPYRNNYSNGVIGGAMPSANLFLARERQRAGGLDTKKFDVYGNPHPTVDPRTQPRVSTEPYTPGPEVLKGRTPDQWHAEHQQSQDQKLKRQVDMRGQIQAGTSYVQSKAPPNYEQMTPDQFKAHRDQSRTGTDDLLGKIRAANGGGSKAACITCPALEILARRCA